MRANSRATKLMQVKVAVLPLFKCCVSARMISEDEYRINTMMMDTLIARVNEQNRLLDALDERTRNQQARIENLLKAVIRLEKRGGFGDRIGNVLLWTGCVATVMIGWANWNYFGLPRTGNEWMALSLGLVPMIVGWVLRYILTGRI